MKLRIRKMDKNTLYLIRGVPGSGKSTFTRKVFGNRLILENDQFHMHSGKYEWIGKRQSEAIDWCIDVADMSLSKKMDCVISNTFTKVGYIDTYKRLADLHDANFVVYRMMGNFHNVHGLNDKMVSNFKNSMKDYPNEIYVYPGNSDYEDYIYSNIKVGDSVKVKEDKFNKDKHIYLVTDWEIDKFGLLKFKFVDENGKESFNYNDNLEKNL